MLLWVGQMNLLRWWFFRCCLEEQIRLSMYMEWRKSFEITFIFIRFDSFALLVSVIRNLSIFTNTVELELHQLSPILIAMWKSLVVGPAYCPISCQYLLWLHNSILEWSENVKCFYILFVIEPQWYNATLIKSIRKINFTVKLCKSSIRASGVEADIVVDCTVWFRTCHATWSWSKLHPSFSAIVDKDFT